METSRHQGPILTLEPLIEAVREGIEASGWSLSGLQKTTSHQFEGRWEGESTRSAYLFFHREDEEDGSIDVYLDETSRGIQGNLALVLDGPELGKLGSVEDSLAALSEAARHSLPEGYRRPVTLRFRLREAGREPSSADTECRFKLRIPKVALESGSAAVASLCAATAEAFDRLLDDRAVRRLLELD